MYSYTILMHPDCLPLLGATLKHAGVNGHRSQPSNLQPLVVEETRAAAIDAARDGRGHRRRGCRRGCRRLCLEWGGLDGRATRRIHRTELAGALMGRPRWSAVEAVAATSICDVDREER